MQDKTSGSPGTYTVVRQGSNQEVKGKKKTHPK